MTLRLGTLGLLLGTFTPAHAIGVADGGLRSVRVLVPSKGNLQHMAFWLAIATGAFRDEGVQVEVVLPPAPRDVSALFEKGDAELAVLPPPEYLTLIGRRVPIVLVANLLRHDPLNLVLRRSVAVERGLWPLDPALSVAERLRRTKGLRIGIAPNPPPRLRALFADHGLDADRHLQVVVVHGKGQNEAFAQGKLDGLFAHTPFVEKALVAQDAVLIVHGSSGDVPALANRQIHALVAQRAFLLKEQVLVRAMVRAIARASRLPRENPAAATDALARQFPNRPRAELSRIVLLYANAMPETPRTSSAGFATALTYFSERRERPSLEGVNLEQFVAPELADDIPAIERVAVAAFGWYWVVTLIGLLGVGVLIVRRKIGKRPG